MQTAKSIPITTNKPLQLNIDNTHLGVSEAKWIEPNDHITIAPGVHAAIVYDQEDGQYTTRFNFWYQDEPIKDYQFDQNHEINMQHTCHRIIKHLATSHDKNTGRPLRTLIEVAYAPYPWQS